MNSTGDIITYMKNILEKGIKLLKDAGRGIRMLPGSVGHFIRKVRFSGRRRGSEGTERRKPGKGLLGGKFQITPGKKMFAGGVGVGLLTGILVTVAVSVSAFDHYAGIAAEHEAEMKSEVAGLESEKEALETKNAQLEIKGDDAQIARTNAEILSGSEEGWSLVLVNEDHPLATDYEPAQLTPIDSERSVDSRIAGDLQQMMADGAAQGLDMYVTSAYRSYERQREVFNAGMQERMKKGLSPLEAYEDTKQSIAFPGTSEHATGLAVDIIANGYSELDEEQASTPEQQWLMAHCWEYGFILRYPQDTGDITGIIYEPWHYRYVGKEAAKEITEQGITLEEYVEGQ